MRSLFWIGALVVCAGVVEASEAKAPFPESPYAFLAHENGNFFRLSRRTGHVWIELNGAWKLVPTNTAFQLADIQRPYPFQFQLIGMKGEILLSNGGDGKSQKLVFFHGTPLADLKFVDIAEPKP